MGKESHGNSRVAPEGHGPARTVAEYMSAKQSQPAAEEVAQSTLISGVNPNKPTPVIQDEAFMGFLLRLKEKSHRTGEKDRVWPWKSLFVFSLNNPIRKLAIYTMEHWAFRYVVLLIILLNTLFLAMGSNAPGFGNTRLGRALSASEPFFAYAFLAEMVVKVIAMGAFAAPGTYIREWWNVLDFVVVVMGILPLLPFVNTSANVSAIRVVRVFRPLRAIQSVKGMRVLVTTLIKSFPMLMDVAVLCTFVFFIFGIVGVNLYGGTLKQRCMSPAADLSGLDPGDIIPYDRIKWYFPDPQPSDEDDFTATPCTGRRGDKSTYVVGSDGSLALNATTSLGHGFHCPWVTEGRVPGTMCVPYQNPDSGGLAFDNILQAWLAIFQSITTEGWTDDIYALQDGNNPWLPWLYSSILTIFGAFFMIQLFLAVLCVHFSEAGDKAEEDEEEARALREAEVAMGIKEKTVTWQLTPADAGRVPDDVLRGPRVVSAVRRFCWNLYFDQRLEALTSVLIVFNTAVMASEYWGETDSHAHASNYINYALTAYFAAEMLVKMTGVGFRRYFADSFNGFDCFVVVLSLTEIILAATLPSLNNTTLSVLRAFRIFRLFKLVKSWKELQRILTTMGRSLKSIAFLGLIMALIMTIFALLGMQLFGYKFATCDVNGADQFCPDDGSVPCPSHRDCYVPCDASDVNTWVAVDGSPYGGKAYCQSFLSGGQTVYKAQVGPADNARSNFDSFGWAMLSLFQMLSEENWNNLMYTGMQAVSDIAAIYFVCFMVVGNFICLNLFLAVLLDAFEGHSEAGEAPPSIGARKPVRALIVFLRNGRPADQRGAGAGPVAESLEVVPRAPSRRGAADAGERGFLGSVADFLGIEPATKSVDELAPGDRPAGSGPGPGPAAGSGPGPVAESATPTPPLESTPSQRRVQIQGLDHPERGGGDGSPAGPMSTARSAPGTLPRVTLLQQMQRASDRRMNPAGAKPLSPAGGGGAEGGAGPRPGGASEMERSEYTKSTTSDMEHMDMAARDRRDMEIALMHPSLFCLSGEPDLNPLRRWAVAIIRHRYFEWFILFVILWSSIMLCLDDPWLDPSSPRKRVLHAFDIVFTVIFTMEAALKITALGFVGNPKAYLRSGFNVLDFCIVLVSILLNVLDSIHLRQQQLSALRALRTARALRPMRMAVRHPGLRVVVGALFGAIPAILNVFLVCILFYLIFAIMGVNFFGGLYSRCVDVDSGDDLTCYFYRPDGQCFSYDECVSGTVTATSTWFHSQIGVAVPPYTVNTEWQQRRVSFDNTAAAVLTLFQVSSTEMWLEILYPAIDSRPYDPKTKELRQPIQNSSVYYVAYFVLWLALSSFFLLELFVGVTIDKFNAMKDKNEGVNVFLTESQQRWVTMRRMALLSSPMRRPPRPAHSRLRQLCYDVATSKRFDGLIISVIVVNVCFMACEHYGMGYTWQCIAFYSNVVFTAVYCIEAILKLTGLGPRSYFRDGWNIFDFLVVSSSVIGIALEPSPSLRAQGNLGIVSLLRVIRVIRIFRLIPKARGLRVLLQTLISSLPALWNVGLMTLIFFFMYAVMGMQLFGQIVHQDFITRHANFETFLHSMAILFRCSTGESWDGIMQDTTVVDSCCYILRDIPALGLSEGDWVNGPQGQLPNVNTLGLVQDTDYRFQCTNGYAYSVIFFISFVLFVSLVLLNLIVAIILDNFTATTEDESLVVNKAHVQEFREVWSRHDLDGSGKIEAAQLPILISELAPPLGVRDMRVSPAYVQQLIMSCDIPNRNGLVTFREVLYALSQRAALDHIPELIEELGQLNSQNTKEELKFWKVMNKAVGHDPTNPPKYSVGHYHAALYVQAAVRGFLARYEVQRRLQGSIGMRTIAPLPPAGGRSEPVTARAGAGDGDERGIATPSVELQEE